MLPARPSHAQRLGLLATGLGAAAFFLQILDAAFTQFAGLGGKPQALAAQALAQGLAMPEAVAWLAWYTFSGVALHAVAVYLGMALVRKVARSGAVRWQRLAQQRGAYLLAGLVALGTLMAWDAALVPGGDALGLAHVLAAGLTGLWGLLVVSWMAHWSRRARLVAGVVAAMGLVAPSHVAHTPGRDGPPDLIVLGVDSLRPDHLASFGGPRGLAPTLDGFVEQAVAFDHAYTPLGRTFVAYSSILSGRYPTSHGARENLYPRALFQRAGWLPQQLEPLGYYRVFSMDESRFANIDRSFGFDAIASPPPGMLDFAFGGLFDTAGTNLAQWLPYSWRLWPHVAGNRAAARTYRSALAVDRVKEAIERAPADRPLLLMAHFCIAHIPFSSAGHGDAVALPQGYSDSPAAYRRAVAVADGQVASTLAALRRAGRLEHAVVVILSDHGEGLGMTKDAWDNWEGKGRQLDHMGHGASALDPSSTRVVLAMMRFEHGKPAWPARRVDEAVSLVDVAPSLVALAGGAWHGPVDGQVLVDDTGQPRARANRPIFVESGMVGASLDQAQPDPAQVANEFAGLYSITPDLRFELDMAAYAPQLAAKQRGVVRGHFGLAATPVLNAAGGCWMLADLSTRRQKCLSDPSQDPVALDLSRLVCAHYAGDTVFARQWCQPGTPAVGKAVPPAPLSVAAVRARQAQ